MDSISTRILLVEDNPGDAKLIEWYIAKPGSGDFQVSRAERLSDAIRELAASRFDLVLLDLSLPDSTGLDTVRSARRAAGMTPIVILTGLDDEETALAALRTGAQDYLVKGKFDSHELTRSLRYAIERERIEQALRQTKEALEAIIAASPAAVLSLDTGGRVLTWNESAEHIFGWTAAEAVGRIPPFVTAGSEAEFGSLLKQVLAGEPVPDLESQRRRKDGALVEVSLSARPIRGADGAATGVVTVLADITQRKQAEAELAAEAERTGILFEHAPDAYYLSDFHGTFMDGNRAAEQLLGYGREELVGENLLKLDLLPMSEVTKVAGLLVRSAFGQATGPDEIVMRRRDGTQVAAELYTHIVTIHGRKVVLNSMRDITERRRIERTLRERVRELDCLYGVARLVEKPGISRDELMQGVVSTLANALQRAEVAGARVRFGGSEYRTPDWDDTTLRIQEPLRIDGVETGAVELGYLPDIGESGLSFLPEEHNLLFAVATRLGRILERLHAAAALCESEERFRRAFEDSEVGKLLTGLDGRLLRVNRAFAIMLGYTVEELQSIDFMAVTHPDDVAVSIETMTRLQTGTDGSARFEKRYMHKDGSVVWVDLSTVLLRDADGKPCHFVADVVNITKRRAAEAKLRESELKFRAIFDHASDGMFLVDPEGRRFLMANSSCLRMLGYSADEFANLRITDIHPAEDLPFVFEQIGDFMKGETGRRADIRFKRKDGSLFAADTSPAGMMLSDKKCILIVFRDITERKQAEAALAESELKFRTVFESSNDAMMVLESGKLVGCNDAALRVFGYSTRDELLGRHPADVSPPLQADGRESRSAADENAAAAFRDGRNSFEWIHQRADGTTFPADVLLTPFDYHGRRVLQATVRDITARKAAEAEIAQKNAELAKLNELKNQFLGMAAHDLRNPLTVVNMASSFLLDSSSKVLSAKQRGEFIRRINDNGEFMLKLINDLLDVARIESGKLDLELATGDLCGLIEENLTMNRMLAEKKGIRLDFAPECGLPPLRYDRHKIEQVLNNLISNAVKFSASGTAVTVRAALSSGTVVVSVQDQGPGIPAEELDHLFKSFSRTSVQSTAGERSTGLGLAISRKIVDGHGGRIWAESEVGRGSTFSFSLPGSDARPAAPEKARRRTSNQTRSAVS